MGSGLKDIGEFGFIKRVNRGCLVRPGSVVRGIGDDAAVFRSDHRMLSLITADLLVERVHFLRRAITGFDLGYKSMAVNLSDIAAMGGIAREAFVSIAIPEDCELTYLEAVYEGMKALAAKFGVNILGGDTTSSKSDLVINVAVYGVAPEDQVLTRDAARPGDVIFSTGTLGNSRAGLFLILNRIEADTPELAALLAAHRHPEPHLREGRLLAAQPGIHAAIDVSDGLSSDLGHILEESRVGARLYAEKLPLSADLRHFCRRFRQSAAEMALAGGEDYTLLLTAAADKAPAIAAEFSRVAGKPLHAIGEITEALQSELVAADGSAMPLARTGWDHFGPPVE